MDNFELYKTMPHLGFYLNDGTPYTTLHIYINDSYIYMVDEWRNIRGLQQSEFTMPRSAGKWIADSIRNKFWQSPENGGLPANQHHLKEEIDGETLKINRVMTMGRPGQKGFMIYNESRKNKKVKRRSQYFATPDVMLIDGGLLDIFAEL